MKKILLALALSSSMFLAACGGGSSGNSSVGNVPYTRTEMAYDFVESVNKYMAGYDMEIVKLDTVHYEGDYIVVYDWEHDSYDAYDLTWFTPGENINDYLYDFDQFFYYDLEYIGGDLYEDPMTGTRFNKDSLSLNSFLKEGRKSEAYKKKVTESVQAQFGLSAQSSEDLAQAYIDLTSMPKSQISATFVDRVAKQAFGFSIDKVEKELLSGNFGAIDDALATASAKTGVSVDELQGKLKKMFNLDLGALK